MLNHKNNYDVYKIVIQAIKFRGIFVDEVTPEEFKAFMKKNKYFVISFKTEDIAMNNPIEDIADISQEYSAIISKPHTVNYYIFESDSNTKKDKFEKIIEKNKAVEHLVILNTWKKNLVKTSQALVSKNNIIIRLVKKDRFYVNIMEHILNRGTVIEIAPKNEIDTFLKHHLQHPKNFPKISTQDITAIWLGAFPGLVIKCIDSSPVSGTTVQYRRCFLHKDDKVIFKALTDEDDAEDQETVDEIDED